MVLAHNINEKIRTKDVQISQNVTFDTMFLSSKTSEGLQKAGFHRPSPVQLHGIPLGKCGFDLLLEAKSGTGKTAVFTVIALEKINLTNGLQVIILAPTREIASQICDVLKQIGSSYQGLCVEVVMGGLPVQDDITKFSKKNVHIVVGSPGRLKHLMQDKHIDVSAVRLLVLDEADKLLEKSFLTDIKYIHSLLPRQKQVILSSATYPESSKEFMDQFVHGAQHICPETNSVLLGVDQKVTYVKFNSNVVRQTKIRFEELIKILSNIQFKQCLIFCNYQVRVAELQRMLTKANWPVEMLHGQQDQLDRLDALKTLQEYKCRILISTDLASRGIDASNIDIVINFEPPFEWQTYLHRIGRAGRFGSYGTAITIASEGNEQKKFTNLFESLNSTLCLSPLWNNNDKTNGVVCKNRENGLDEKSEENSSENNATECYQNIETTNGNNDDVKIEIYDLLYTPRTSKIETESFADLMISYEKFNLNDKVDSEYQCITFPKGPENCVTSSKDSTIHLCKPTLEVNHKEKDTDDENSIFKLSKEKSKPLDEIDDENNLEMDLLKLGLPTAFSSSKYKNINKTHATQKEAASLKNKRIDKKNNLPQQEPCTSSLVNFKNTQNGQSKIKKTKNYSKYIADERINVPVCNNKEKSKSYKVPFKTTYRHEDIEINSSDSISSFDSSYDPNYNIKYSSYMVWYKQLKIRTKQIEMAYYINELSSM